jgi:hypothetical protein
LPGDGGKRKPSVPPSGKILIPQFFSVSRGLLRLHSESVVAEYNNDLPRERDGRLNRFPFPGKLFKNLKPLRPL